MIITIDGPSGAGKSSVARLLAQRLDFEFLDTGAMYRAVTLDALRRGVAPDDHEAVSLLLQGQHIRNEHGRTYLNGKDVSAEIRTPEVTHNVRYFAESPIVRQRLTLYQRASGQHKNLVSEGRDQGTVVFPDAEVKFFLTANEEVRAARRQRDFVDAGRETTIAQVQAEIHDRDERDSHRALAPLRPADDAIIIDTSTLTLDQVVATMEQAVREWMDADDRYAAARA